MPSQTPSAVPTATRTPSPEPTPTPDIVALLMATVEPQTLGSFPSPDGQRLAEVIVYTNAHRLVARRPVIGLFTKYHILLAWDSNGCAREFARFGNAGAVGIRRPGVY
jgi:hypothetical protein